MKELSIKEKAKAYDGNYKAYTELINRLEDVKNAIKKQNYGIAMDILCKPYPEFQITTSTELRESEDEKVRKAIINVFASHKDYENFYGVSVEDILAWLEKHGQVNESLTSEDEKIKKMLRDVISQWRNGNQAWCGDVKLIDAALAWLEKQSQVNKSLTSEDERIRKEMIEILEKEARDFPSSVIAEKSKSWIAWLEKQGEHANFRNKIQIGDKVTRNEDGVLVNLSQLQRVAKPADKVEPKFKVGDFIANDYCRGKVVELTNDAYLLDTGQGIPFSCEHNIHLWTIQNAMDGDKIKPKFKVGDWVTNGRYTRLIVGINSDCPYYMFKDGTSKRIKDIDKKYYLWTIQDAKDGDVLANDTIVLIVDHLGTFENRPIIYSWYFADSNKFYGVGPSESDRWEVEGFTPATKEQRDLLFAKIKEAGYEWDAEKKELKKIEQKPVWSKEDEEQLILPTL